MLKQIITNGTDAQRNFAMRTMETTANFRGQRQAMRDFASVLSFAISTGKERIIYDAKEGSTLPGTIVRKEGDPAATDPAVNEAYDGSGVTYDLFSEIYNRDSIDGNGLRLDSTVHYQKGYDNAFWNGRQMVYGDGDEDQPVAQRLFNRFTIAIDIIGHELTHGVTEYEAKLNYFTQSGALNESMSDVFGSLVKQYQKQQTADQADWIIGEGLFTANVNGIGIRSMKAPGTAYNDPTIGKDPQPAHMDDYVNTAEDNGGVHINSGIPNRAFYVTATEIGGFAWEKAGNIWYVTLRDKLTATSNFQQAADATYQVAGQLYGAGSAEQLAVQKGWAAVGITPGSSTPPPPPTPTPTPTPGDGCLTAIFKALGLMKK
jgi:Zn-dependent metalloprotease